MPANFCENPVSRPSSRTGIFTTSCRRLFALGWIASKATAEETETISLLKAVTFRKPAFGVRQKRKKGAEIRLCGALYRFWRERYIFEGCGWLAEALNFEDSDNADQAIDRNTSVPEPIRAQAFYAVGSMYWRIGRRDLAEICCEASRRIYDNVINTASLTNLTEWKTYENKQLQISRPFQLRDYMYWWAYAHSDLGTLASFEDRDNDAEEKYLLSYAIRELLHDELGRAAELTNRGRMAEKRNENDEALRLYEESLAIKQNATDQDERSIAASCFDLARVHLKRNENPQALRRLVECLSYREPLAGNWMLAETLEGFAAHAAAAGFALNGRRGAQPLLIRAAQLNGCCFGIVASRTRALTSTLEFVL